MEKRICSWCGNEVNAHEYCPACTQQFVSGELPDPANMTPQERHDEVMLRRRLEIDVQLLKERMSQLLGRMFYTHDWLVSPDKLAQMAYDAYPTKEGGNDGS